jgi:O-antigen/teichoic acid export membrane protein
LAGLVGDIGRKFDQFILAAFIHPSGFALYAVAKFQIPLIMLFYKSVGNVTLPKISEYSLQGKTEKVIELWHKVICYYGSITIPLVTFFVVMAKPIITLIYTDQYVGSVNIFRIMIFVLFIQMFSFGTIPKAYKATKFILLSNFVAMISGTLLGYILIKYFGLYGGAISFLISIYITGSMQLVKSKKLLKLRFGQWLPWKFLGMIVMLALLCSLTLIPILNFPIPKLLRIAIGALIYFSLLAGLFEKLSIFSVRTFLAKKWAHQLKGIFSNRFSHRTEGD